LVQGHLDVLDEHNGVALEWALEFDVVRALFTHYGPFGCVDYALALVVRIGVTVVVWLGSGLSLSLLVGNDELILLHPVAETFAKGKLGVCNNVWLHQAAKFFNQVWAVSPLAPGSSWTDWSHM
jgi:hypothetical protein